MQRPPLDPNAAIIGRADLPRLSRQCGIITAASFGCYGWGVARYGIGPQASTIAFLGLAAAQLLHAFSARSETHSILEHSGLPPNRFLAASVWGALGGVIAGQFVPGVRGLLGTAAVGAVDFLVCAAAAGGSLFLNELWKHVGPARTPKALPAPDEGILQPAAQAA
jgi:Ca2+-transporting ATPase